MEKETFKKGSKEPFLDAIRRRLQRRQAIPPSSFFERVLERALNIFGRK